jgi:hypothetical protein
MTSPSFSRIWPRLHAFDIVEAGQSPGASLVVAAEASGATFFVAATMILGPVVLVETLAAAAVPFFFTIPKFLWG